MSANWQRSASLVIAFACTSSFLPTRFDAAAQTHAAYGPEAQMQLPVTHDELDPMELEALDPNLAFALRLHLLRGHLAAAKVLASQDRYKEAGYQISHILRSCLAPIEVELARRGLPSLRKELLAVDVTIDGKKGELALLGDMRHVERRIWEAYDTIPERQRQSVAFNLALALLLFKEAAQQYQAAWQGIKLTHLHEFQNGYGFLMEARWLLARSLPILRKQNVKAATNIENAYLRLRAAWPSIDPPPKPVLPYSTINGLVAAIEINANRL